MKHFLSQTTGIGLLLFVILSIYNIVLDIKEDIAYIKKIELLQAQIAKIESNSAVVLELQRERGLTSIYFANPSKKHQEKMFLQRDASSKIILNNFETLKKSLQNLRLLADSNEKSAQDVFNIYSELIRTLLLDTKSLTYHADDKELKNDLLVYNDLHALQEILGQIRAKVGVVLSSDKMTQAQEENIKRTNTLFDNQIETTFMNDILSSYKYTRLISKTKCLKKSLKIAQNLKSELNKKGSRLSAIEWFSLSTCAVDKINLLAKTQIKIVNANLAKYMIKAENKRTQNFLLWLFGFLILTIFVYISIKKSRELLKEQAMLRNYKRAIDYSSMVSISDTDGFITHVNKNLSEVSGYSEEEFLSRRYNMVFHPDMSKNRVEKLHLTMLKREVYNGILKNMTKDGESFWADTFIIPILDDKEELVEYITIGCDISEILHLNDEIRETQEELIYRLGEAVESRNRASGNHIKRVAHYSKLLAQLYKLSEDECKMIFAASSMHDVGKIAIPDSILLKPAKLSEEEWVVMKTHSEIGYKLFKDSKRALLIAAADIAYQHHEFYNGKGYPRGLKGEEISIFGRIVAIADVFDALCSVRPYKEAWDIQRVKALISEESGKQFDPRLVKLFIDNFDEFLTIWNHYK